MSKFVPYEKMSKKQKREQDALRRQTWGEMSPVTRRPENSKAYDRRKAQQWKKEPPAVLFLCPYGAHVFMTKRIASNMFFQEYIAIY